MARHGKREYQISFTEQAALGLPVAMLEEGVSAASVCMRRNAAAYEELLKLNPAALGRSGSSNCTRKRGMNCVLIFDITPSPA
ncbi:MAG TPA: hypothetical protein VGM08_03305 [Candidatus Saccharimonadales bacterium]|jgi:hypothetical protein